MSEVQTPVAQQERENNQKQASAPKPAPSSADAQQNERKKWADEQTRIDHLPMDQRHAAQAKLHDDMAAAKKGQKPLSLDMTPDEYVARVKQEREAALAQEEKEMQDRHKAEDEALANKHKTEADDLANERKRLDDEMKAVRAHVEMWQREDAQLAANPADRDAVVRRFDQERVALANDTHYEVLEPRVGDTTIPGFPDHPLPGHPWIRPMRVGSTGRLHPEI